MFYTERITIYKEEKSTIMNVFLRAIACIVVICGFFFLLAQGLNYLQKPNALDNVEKRLDEAAEKESVLTDNEKKLKQEARLQLSKVWILKNYSSNLHMRSN